MQENLISIRYSILWTSDRFLSFKQSRVSKQTLKPLTPKNNHARS